MIQSGGCTTMENFEVRRVDESSCSRVNPSESNGSKLSLATLRSNRVKPDEERRKVMALANLELRHKRNGSRALPGKGTLPLKPRRRLLVSNQSEVVCQIEGLPGGEENRQEISLDSSIPCKSTSVLIFSRTHHFSEEPCQIYSDLIRFLNLGVSPFYLGICRRDLTNAASFATPWLTIG
jgi:hypothetical protein